MRIRKLIIVISLFLLSGLYFEAQAVSEINHGYIGGIGVNTPVTFETGISSYIYLEKDYIGKGGKCSATLNERNVTDKYLTGPTSDGYCKFSLTGSDFEQFGITKEHIGKNIPISFNYFPLECSNLSCGDSIKTTFQLLASEVSGQGTEIPGTESGGVCIESGSLEDIKTSPVPIADCESFITKPVLGGNPCGFCEVRINGEKPGGASYFDSVSGHGSKGCSGVEILPDQYSRFKISGPGTANIKWLYFPVECFSETCAQVIETNVEVTPCGNSGSSSKALSLAIDDLNLIKDDLLQESKDSQIRTLRLIGNRVNRTINLIEGALSSSEEEDLDSCDGNLTQALNVLDSTISQLESRQCKFRTTRRCIPVDIAEDFINDLQDVYDNLDEATLVDDDDDGYPDVCVVDI